LEELEVELVRTGRSWVVAAAADAGFDGPSVVMMVVKKGDAAKVGSGVRQSIQLLEVGGCLYRRVEEDRGVKWLSGRGYEKLGKCRARKIVSS
jgi:hypothetical protein